MRHIQKIGSQYQPPPQNAVSPENTVPISSPQENVTNTVDRNSASSQRPWMQNRTNRPRQINQENSQFEGELLTLLSNRTPDIASYIYIYIYLQVMQ
ncbi:unnamed protein product [Euphydryas editha]|uniref:Uncharacterized protein n=1 Tax=Euphydryas editha TaxID=104508 RepID=A0AAU9TF35_EUPED|nr:unnamed protein product [Euphydryas editha]